MQDSTHVIVTSLKHFFSGTLISRCTGLAREVAMAFFFGINPSVAAFWMAFRFSHLLRRLFGEGALHTVFVPHFESLRKQNRLSAARFFYDLSTGVALLLLSIVLLVELMLGATLLYGSVSTGNVQVLRLTMLMMPALVFISLYALNTSLLNCERSFFVPSVAPTALNLIWILAILLLRKFSSTQAIEYLAMILVLAFAFQWLVTMPKVMHYLSKELGSVWRVNQFSGEELLKIMRPFAWGILGVAATQINSALDAIFARAADPQGPAYLWYALRLQQLPLALFGVGLTGALLPPMARAIEGGIKENYLHFLNFSLKKAFLLLFPLMIALFVLGFSSINLVYGHGAFSQDALVETTLCLWAYGSSLIPTTCVLILAAAFYGHKNYKTPMLIALLTVGLNLLLNALFVYAFDWGAISIALATSLTACLNSLLLAATLKKEYGLSLNGLVVSLLKVTLASLSAASVTIYIGANVFHDNTLLWLTHKQLAQFPKELSTQLIIFGAQSVCFGLLFLIAAYALGIQEVRTLMFWLKNRRFMQRMIYFKK